jgi:octaprenyl-diphosphate synthase
MDIAAVRTLIADDFQATDRVILQHLSSDVALINQIGRYIVSAGGKRLRPMIVLLAARALGYQEDQHIYLAAIIEFIHTATLLHDDVVDSSEQRRQRDTANAVWGNAASVLVGDFLYSRAFEMMVAVDNMRVMAVLSSATNRIAEGEVLQLLNCNDPDVGEAQYREVILRKTATLFEAGARLGGVLHQESEVKEQALADYGRHLGMAFQMIDDALDYGSSDQDIGKNLGDDLAEGKPTLPLIRAIQTGDAATQKLLRQAIEQGEVERIDEICQAIQATDAIAYTVQQARQEVASAQQALQQLPDTPYRMALSVIADFSVERDL